MWGYSSVEVKELRHRGRLWRLADFVGGTGGSTKPSTDECCGKMSHMWQSVKSSCPSWKVDMLKRQQHTTCMRFCYARIPNGPLILQQCSRVLQWTSVCLSSRDICSANTDEPINLVLRRGPCIPCVHVRVCQCAKLHLHVGTHGGTLDIL